ncbi:RING-H2 finger protein ATL2-like [Impatiens glandulifera]|uniref:RING-H2 finger protein ATL2-like n=1 Tax=Impatiens glandulifera TaxID=253017 RepID=UPI001FB15486|nr:RING-H2 finger protein ATL2-like [Impatiens glandulifera]
MDFDTHTNHMLENNEDTTKFGASSLSGKLMFTAIVVMFAVIVFILFLHLYARCYLLRSRRRRNHRNGGTQLFFYVDPTTSNTTTVRGLESSVLNSLPVFVYSPEKHTHLPECAVCLSEFEENEKGRILPKCNHGFHIDCIDMWFHSHSTCPICRALVEPVEDKQIHETENTEAAAGPSERRKELAIDIPKRGLTENEIGQSSSAAVVSQGFMSPVTRFLSFTSMLSMNRRSAGNTPSGVGTSSGESLVLDIEKGLEDSNQNQNKSRAQTPR